jgi:hypothetical protein
MKKLITLLTLLFILTSCFGKKSDEIINIDTNSGNTQVDWGNITVTITWSLNEQKVLDDTDALLDDVITTTGEVTTVTWSLNEQEVLNDIDILLNDIIISAENE